MVRVDERSVGRRGPVVTPSAPWNRVNPVEPREREVARGELDSDVDWKVPASVLGVMSEDRVKISDGRKERSMNPRDEVEVLRRHVLEGFVVYLDKVRDDRSDLREVRDVAAEILEDDQDRMVTRAVDHAQLVKNHAGEAVLGDQ